ncbi:MAG: hypothetical protein ACI9SP_000654 [Arenicella sp.]|jgi:hypothetical protein
MTSILNRYMHAYVALPVASSFLKHNVFDVLSSGKSIFDVIEEMKANPGYFNIALKMFESLGWITKHDDACYEVTNLCPPDNESISKIVTTYLVPFEEYIGSEAVTTDQYLSQLDFSKLQDLLPTYDSHKDALSSLNYLSNGAILLPLLYFLKQASKTNSRDFEMLDIRSKNCIYQFLFKNGVVLKPNGSSIESDFSDLGQALWDSVDNAGVTLSYRPLLAKIEQLLFYDSKKFFSEIGKEAHIDRELNVIGSGAQHGVFFKGFIDHISDYLAMKEVDNLQLVDMGCGDGTLLKSCYDSIDRKLKKEKKVALIGVDLNKEAISVAHKTLEKVPHHLCVGNINNPQGVLTHLEKQGFEKSQLLHIRTFLDHNCPLDHDIQCERQTSVALNGNLNSDPYSNADGDAISAELVIDNLARNFGRWSEVVGEKGLLTLEVFSLSSVTVKKYLEETENLHFDALHGFSNQYLVTADSYLMAAANAGLIPSKSSFKKYPRALPYCRISQQHFFNRNFHIRHAKESDLNALCRLEELSLSESLRADKSELSRRLRQYGKGVYLACKQIGNKEEVVGVLYTQRIEKEALVYEMKYDNVEKYHNDSGKICQLISLQVDPSQQDGLLGNELLSFGILHNFVREGIRKIVGVSRCALYNNKKGDYTAYVKGKNKLGYVLDPILRLHHQEGAKIIDVVENYRERDLDNLGYGVHITYDYLTWSSK